MHSWIGAVRVDVVISCVFAHLEGGSPTDKGGPNQLDDLEDISTWMINPKRRNALTAKSVPINVP